MEIKPETNQPSGSGHRAISVAGASWRGSAAGSRSHFVSVFVLLGAVLAAQAESPSAAPPVTALAFAPDGNSLVVGSQRGLELLSWPGLDLDRDLATDLENIHDICFAPDGKSWFVAGGAPARYGTVEFRGWPDGELIRTVSFHDDVIYGVAVSGQYVATAAADRGIVVCLTSVETRLYELTGHSRPATAVAFLPETSLLVSASLDQSVRLWDLTTGQLRRTLDNHTAGVRDLTVRPSDGTLAMVASASVDRTVRFWQPTIGRLVRFARLPAEPLSMAWSHGGRFVVASCTDGHLRVIDPDTAEVVADHAVLDGWAYEVAVDPSGLAAAVGGAGGIVRRVALQR